MRPARDRRRVCRPLNSVQRHRSAVSQMTVGPDLSYLFVARRNERPVGKAAEAVPGRAVGLSGCRGSYGPTRDARPTPPTGLAASRSRKGMKYPGWIAARSPEPDRSARAGRAPEVTRWKVGGGKSVCSVGREGCGPCPIRILPFNLSTFQPFNLSILSPPRPRDQRQVSAGTALSSGGAAQRFTRSKRSQAELLMTGHRRPEGCPFFRTHSEMRPSGGPGALASLTIWSPGAGCFSTFPSRRCRRGARCSSSSIPPSWLYVLL